MTDPESVYRVKPELPLFASSAPVSGNGAEGGDSALKESGLSTSSSVRGAQCENGGCARETSPAAPDFAPTRRGMPETSYKAAASVVNLGRTRDAILSVLRDYGWQTDEEIADVYNFRHYLGRPFDYPKVSPSGLRSRRSELVKLGLVCDSGQRAKTQSGRESIVWSVK